jgi:hypothetical protein
MKRKEMVASLSKRADELDDKISLSPHITTVPRHELFGKKDSKIMSGNEIEGNVADERTKLLEESLFDLERRVSAGMFESL